MKTFKDLDLTFNPKIKAVISHLRDFAKNPDIDKIVLSGQAGIGKTHLAEALLTENYVHNRIIDSTAGQNNCMIQCSDMEYLYRASLYPELSVKTVKDQRTGRPVHDIFNFKMVLLEELKVEFKDGKPLISSYLIDALEKFLAGFRGKTVITTNLRESEIDKFFGSRVFDRLIKRCDWINMTGQSFRRTNYRVFDV